jgi:ubiquinone/menaquinone biosynthesis C-methylase UbiE
MSDAHPQVLHLDQLSARPYRMDIAHHLSNATHRPERVLDIGCGPDAFDLKALRSQGSSSLVGIDMALDLTSKNGDICLLRSDIDDCSLPFRAESFDTILLHNVIEHLQDPSRVLSEAHRVLAHGGVLSMITENQACLKNRLKSLMGISIYFPLDRWMSQEDRVEKCGRRVFTGHIREYTIREIGQMLQRSGFKVDVLKLRAAAYPSNRVPDDPSSGARMIETMSTSRTMFRLYNIAETVLPGCGFMICAIASKRTV